MTQSRNAGKKAWNFRRKLVVATLCFCAGVVTKITIWGHESASIGEALVTMAFGLSGTVIGSYIFGAVWDDRGKNAGAD
jgi:hypothetical protein